MSHFRKTPVSVLLAACATLVAACSWSNDPVDCASQPWMPGACQPKQAHAALLAIDGCQDLLTTLKQSSLEKMQEQVMQNLEWALEYGGGCYRYEFDEDFGYGSGSQAPSSNSEPGAREYSTTNTQEAGVDEADFIKNDGTYIYLLAGDGLMIFKAWPAPQTHEVSSFGVEGIPRNLYVHADRAVIYSEIHAAGESDRRYGDCYYDGWDYNCGGNQSTLKVTILDISNPAQPQLERELLLSGSYTNSRRIGNAVHTVVTFPEVQFPGLRYWPEDLNHCEDNLPDSAILAAFGRLLKTNQGIIENTTLYDWLPSVRDTRHLNNGNSITDEGLLQDCRNFYEPALPGGQSMLTVMSLDVLDPFGLHLTSIVGHQGEVYASPHALYVATYHHHNGRGPWFYADSGEENQEATNIHKFSLSSQPAAATYEASGVVLGRVLNQFSMGEHNHHLRVATTTGFVWHPETHNSVYVLEQQDSVLETIGLVTGIAPTEDIRSARFVGDRGFIVTFKKTDPLFAIDLSDPANPRIAGELKIPGFSTYIHMMDPDHLLTIGFDADDQGSFAWFQGIELQIFDVSNLAEPAQIHKEIIGTRGTSSEATGNHLAFNYFAPKDLLALPMAICEGSGGGGSYGTEMAFSGLMVWDVTTGSGFAERGRVSHEAQDDEPDNYGCGNWWSNPNSRVKRSIVMDDYIFSISDTLLKVNHLNSLSNDLLIVELPPIPSDPYSGY